MPANPDAGSSRFKIGTCGGMPFAVPLDAPVDIGSDVSEAELEGLTQSYLADAPWHLSMPPEEAHAVFGAEGPFVAAGAKEGHGITRQAVDVIGLAPPERPVVAEGARRAVVALLDTVVSPHDWIGDSTGDDPFWRDARRLEGPWEPEDADGCAHHVPVEVGESTSTHAGHGTFITGVVRLVAPGATVISLPVMDSTGVVDEALLESALRWLLERAGRAVEDDRPDLAVDVVNLSFGRYLHKGQPVPQQDRVGQLLTDLGGLGVRVIASAGNRGTSLEVIPAAWSGEDTDDRTALRSVGALDPDDGAAGYSNYGPWVSVGARGTALLSCLPQFGEVPWPPPGESPEVLAVKEDPNLQRSTFGRWSGTSFAAAVVSATQAARLMTPRIGGGLRVTTTRDVVARAKLAWGTFGPMPVPVPAASVEATGR